MKNIPNSILTMLAGIALTLVSIWYGQNHGLLPVQASDDARVIDGLFNTMLVVGTGIFLLVEGTIIISAIRFRRRKGDTTDGPPIAGNITLEIVWTAIPVFIVLFLSVYSFDVYRNMGGFDPDAIEGTPEVQVAMAETDMATPIVDGQQSHKTHSMHHHLALGVGADPSTEGKEPDLSVDVMGLQYAWIFTYPESGVTSGELHIPVNSDIKLTIKAQDVLHAFWLPEFRLKQDAIPGQPAELRFQPRLEGEYPIVCAELCGPYHGAMGAKLYVESQEAFDQWLQSQVVAQKEGDQTVASLTDRTDADRLAPVAAELGVTAETLKSLQPAA